MEQNTESRNRPIHTWSIEVLQRYKEVHWRKYSQVNKWYRNNQIFTVKIFPSIHIIALFEIYPKMNMDTTTFILFSPAPTSLSLFQEWTLSYHIINAITSLLEMSRWRNTKSYVFASISRLHTQFTLFHWSVYASVYFLIRASTTSLIYFFRVNCLFFFFF